MSRIRLILIPPSAALPASCLTLDAQGVVLTRGVLELGSGYAPEPMRNVAVVPGADVLVRWLELPSGSPAQMAATALHLLRDDLAAPSDRLTAVLGTVPTSGRRLVAVAGRSLLQTWSDYLASFGLRADVMIPDCLILPEPEPEDEGVLTAALFGADLALRGRELALSVQPDLAEAVAAGRAVKRIERADEIERLLAAAALNPPINLLAGGGRRVEADRRGWKRAAALAAALIVSPLILTLAAAGHDEWRARDTENRAEAAARRAYPDIAPWADAVAEATRRLSTAPPGGAAAAAAALFAAVESVEEAELDSLTVDEAGVRATVTYAAYQDLDALQQAMAAKGMSLTDDSTVDDQGKVVSEVRVGGAG
ncbi:type II secretion system protein GspL [Brevundimonas bullata]|uniref:type II secretion system protein GspL n=1 Tax=Brevundimonas bullata TaxID=13160 RepID=UPI000E0AADA6|nr:type II secretion system protein GspL [Brevundimonas bullata]WQE37416.1 type II secretion system protein GspL [Brevundimonas bullata]